MKKSIGFLFAAVLFMLTNSFSQNTAPLNEGFETTVFPPENWTAVQIKGNAGKWMPASNNPHSGQKYAQRPYSSSGSSENMLITPALIPQQNDTFSFWMRTPYHYSGTTIKIKLSATTDDTNAFTTLLASYSEYDEIPSEWTKRSFDLSQYEGQTVYIAFHVIDNNGLTFCLDDVSGPQYIIPACSKLFNVGIKNVTSTDALIKWNDISPDDEYTVHYKKSTESTYSTFNTSDTAVKFSDEGIELSPNTDYMVYITYMCNEENKEIKSESKEFHTECTPLSEDNLPYVMDFEGLPVTPGTIPDCWHRIQKLHPEHPFISQNASYAHTGTQYLYSFYSDEVFTTKGYEGNIKELQITFYAKPANNSDAYGSLLVGVITDVTDSNSFLQAAAFSATQWDTANYKEITVDFSGITLPENSGPVYYPAIKRQNGNTYSWYIDDLSIEKTPDCKKVENIVTSNATQDGITIQWTQAGEENTQWEVYYKTLNSQEWEKETVNGEPKTTLSGLEASSLYEFYIQTVCGDINPKSLTYKFQTLCLPTDNFPFIENFVNLTTQQTGCWSIDKMATTDEYS